METPRWNLGTKVAFRFLFIYFPLYTTEVPMQFVPISGMQHLFDKYTAMWRAIAIWLGQHVLHVQHNFSANVFNPMGGSHDTTIIYLESFSYLVFAALGTLIWSVLDRKRANYSYLHSWLMLYLRIMLAIALVNYGSYKIFPAQFPEPSLSRLVQRYGNTSPTNLLWTFMGASPVYSWFAGFVELLGALLLLIPGLATLGALMAFGALTNVLMLNFGYDVAVKLATIHWLVMAAFIMAPDIEALTNFFVLHRSAQASSEPPLFQRKWLQLAAVTLPLVFGLLFIGFRLHRSQQLAAYVENSRKSAPLYGIWLVNDFQVDGKRESDPLTDPLAWKRMIVASNTDGMIEAVAGPDRQVSLHFDTPKKAFNMTMNDRPGWTAAFNYDDRLPGMLIVSGTIDGHVIRATLQKEDDSKFLLRNRPFRWIQETADNH